MNVVRIATVAVLSALAIGTHTAHAEQTPNRAQVRAELAQAKANNQFSFGELDYPVPVAGRANVSRAQVVAELQQARADGLLSVGELDYPPVAKTSSATVTRAHVRNDLAHAKTAGLLSSGEEDYPPAGI